MGCAVSTMAYTGVVRNFVARKNFDIVFDEHTGKIRAGNIEILESGRKPKGCGKGVAKDQSDGEFEPPQVDGAVIRPWRAIRPQVKHEGPVRPWKATTQEVVAPWRSAHEPNSSGPIKVKNERWKTKPY